MIFITNFYIHKKTYEAMKELYILVLSFPLMYGLVNNSTCQCTCQKPYLGDPGDNLSDIVKKSLKYLIETEYIV